MLNTFAGALGNLALKLVEYLILIAVIVGAVFLFGRSAWHSFQDGEQAKVSLSVMNSVGKADAAGTQVISDNCRGEIKRRATADLEIRQVTQAAPKPGSVMDSDAIGKVWGDEK